MQRFDLLRFKQIAPKQVLIYYYFDSWSHEQYIPYRMRYIEFEYNEIRSLRVAWVYFILFYLIVPNSTLAQCISFYSNTWLEYNAVNCVRVQFIELDII